jgi:RHS repeat-associated protein
MMKEGGERYFLHGDHLGSTRVVTDASGQPVKELDYAPFGQTTTETGSLIVPKKFTGKELDPSTGLYDYGARFYDPVLGRFLSPDPLIPDISNPQALNRYSYVYNNPLKYTDPTGRTPDYTFDPILWAMDVNAFREDPSFLNGLAVVLDGGALLFPVIPAVAGVTIRGLVTAVEAMGTAGKQVGETVKRAGQAVLRSAPDLASEAGFARMGGKTAKEVPKLLNPGINVTEKGMQHVLERHTVNGIAEFAGKSKFATGINFQKLIQQGTQMPMVRQPNGNFARTFDSGVAIGIDRTGQASSTVTIVTRPNGDLVTMFPGDP